MDKIQPKVHVGQAAHRGQAAETAGQGSEPQDQVSSGGGIGMHNCWDPSTWRQEPAQPTAPPPVETDSEEAARVKSGGINPQVAFALQKDYQDAPITNLKTDDRVEELKGYYGQGWEGPIPDAAKVLNRGDENGPWKQEKSPINTFKYSLSGKEDSNQTITFDARDGSISLDSERVRSTVGLADTIRESLVRDFDGNVSKPNGDALSFSLPMG